MGIRKFDDINDLLHSMLNRSAEFPAKFTHEGKDYVVAPEEHHSKAVDALKNAVNIYHDVFGQKDDK